MAVVVADVKTLFKFGLSDAEVTPHLNRAIRDFASATFEEPIDELEAIGSKTIYYLAPLLWSAMANRINDLDGSMETYKDIGTFQRYWLERSNSAKVTNEETITKQGEAQWSSI